MKSQDLPLNKCVVKFLETRGKTFIHRGRVYGGGTIDEMAEAFKQPSERMCGTVFGLQRAQILADSGLKRKSKNGRLARVFYKA